MIGILTLSQNQREQVKSISRPKPWQCSAYPVKHLTISIRRILLEAFSRENSSSVSWTFNSFRSRWISALISSLSVSSALYSASLMNLVSIVQNPRDKMDASQDSHDSVCDHCSQSYEAGEDGTTWPWKYIWPCYFGWSIASLVFSPISPSLVNHPSESDDSWLHFEAQAILPSFVPAHLWEMGSVGSFAVSAMYN